MGITHTPSHSMGSSSSSPTIPERTAVPTGVTRIHVIGMRGPFGGMGSPNVGKAHRVAELIRKTQPAEYETWFYFDNSGFRPFLNEQLLEFNETERAKESTNDKGTTVAEHHSMPFVWLESSDAEGKRVLTAIGGRDKFDEWARKEFADVPEVVAEAREGFSFLRDWFFDNDSKSSTAAAVKTNDDRSCMPSGCSATAKTTAA